MIKKILLYYAALFFIITSGLNAQVSGNGNKIIDPANFDTSVSPTTDFFRYANGTWLKNNPVPPQFSRWGSFSILAEKNNEILHMILEKAASDKRAAKGSIIQMIGDLYYSAMDTNVIEKLGMDPISDELNRLNTVSDLTGLQRLLARYHMMRFGGFFNMFAGQDDKNSESVLLQFSQGGLGLGNKDYYLKEDARLAEIRSQYIIYIENLFKLSGDDENTAKLNASSVMKLETRLARASMSRVEMRNPEATYHKMTYSELQSLTPSFSWKDYFSEQGLTDPSIFAGGVLVAQPEYFKELNAVMKETPLKDLKIYMKLKLLFETAEFLSKKFADENFRFNGTILNGIRERQPRWKQSLSIVNSVLGEPLGKLFVDSYFKPEAKEKALELVRNIIASLHDRILKLDWMSDKTKEEAIKKLSKMKVKIGYPEKWKDYTGLQINRSSLLQNVLNGRIFRFKKNMDKIGKPADKLEWGMTPQLVNASYSPGRNDITFPAGILQPPFFDPDADDAVNYGGIGAVIGHEITHGFDDQGRKFDADGNLRDWWTPEDAKKYEERAGRLADQFSSFAVIDSMRVNGKLTLGENTADLGGLIISYYALQKSLEGKSRIKIDGFTPEQRFFLSYAQIWRSNILDENLRMRINNDPHSPDKFRVNGPLSNMTEFRDAFNGRDGEPMVRPESERVRIW